MRVTITCRDGASAVERGGAMDAAFAAARKRDAEETQRFSMPEEDWDVIGVSMSA